MANYLFGMALELLVNQTISNLNYPVNWKV